MLHRCRFSVFFQLAAWLSFLLASPPWVSVQKALTIGSTSFCWGTKNRSSQWLWKEESPTKLQSNLVPGLILNTHGWVGFLHFWPSMGQNFRVRTYHPTAKFWAQAWGASPFAEGRPILTRTGPYYPVPKFSLDELPTLLLSNMAVGHPTYLCTYVHMYIFFKYVYD